MAIKVPPPPGPSDRSSNMRSIRRRDTGPELRLRRILHEQGLRFRVDYAVSDGHPRAVRVDIAFTRRKVAVFVDGCFWHGCPEHGRKQGGRNDEYWSAKIARNVERDYEQAQRLRDADWTVLRLWEHEDPAASAERVREALGLDPAVR